MKLYNSNVTNINSLLAGAIFLDSADGEIDGLRMSNISSEGVVSGLITDRCTLSIKNSHFENSVARMFYILPFSVLTL